MDEEQKNLEQTEAAAEQPEKNGSGRDPSRQLIVYIAAGAYIFYLGIKILTGVIAETVNGWTGSQIGLCCAAAAFLVIGAFLVVKSGIRFMKLQSGSNTKEDEDNG